jgi:Mor family transcriptional regulator
VTTAKHWSSLQNVWQPNTGGLSGLAILRAVYEELGGLRITIPTIRCLKKTERVRRIRNAFNGVNHQELAIRWGMSIRQVRRIVNHQ